MIRTIAFTVLLFCCLSSLAQIKNPFLSLKYDSVVLYNYEPVSEEKIVDDSGQLNTHVTKNKKLDVATVNAMVKQLKHPPSQPIDIVGCFNPHLGVVWYTRGKVIAHLSVCLMCSQLYAVPMVEGRLDYFPLHKSLWQFFDNLRKKNSFPEYKDEPLTVDPPIISK